MSVDPKLSSANNGKSLSTFYVFAPMSGENILGQDEHFYSRINGTHLSSYVEGYFSGHAYTYRSTSKFIEKFEMQLPLIQQTDMGQSGGGYGVSLASRQNSYLYDTRDLMNGLTYYNFHHLGFRGGMDLLAAIVYDRVLSQNDRKRVETYLAIKYGISIYSYVNSDNVNLYTSYNNNMGKHMIVLGRDDTAGIDQRVATSHKREHLIASTSMDFTSLNNDITRTSLPRDKQFLFFGSDGGTMDEIFSSFEYVTNDDNRYLTRVNQRWEVKNINGISTVHLKFPSFDSSWVVIASSDSLLENDLKSIGTLSDDGTVTLSNLGTLGELFYLTIAKKSTKNTQKVSLPIDHFAEPLFSETLLGLGLLSDTDPTDRSIRARTDYLFDTEDNISLSFTVPKQVILDSSNPSIRFSLVEIKAKGGFSSMNETCRYSLCKDTFDFNLSDGIDSETVYIWEKQHRIVLNTSNVNAKDIPKLKITYRDSNQTEILSGSGDYWITEGDKVELLVATEGVSNLIVNGLSFTDGSGIPDNRQLEVVIINGIEYYSNILTENMYSYNTGEVTWSYGTKIHEFENILGEAFTLDQATLYTGIIESDAAMKTRTQVSDIVLDAITVQGQGYKPVLFTPDSDRTPDESIIVNSLVYDPKDNNSSDHTAFGRNKFIGKLYFTRPGRYRLEWLLGGDDFPVGSDGIQRLVIEVNVKFPEIADYYHVAETPDVSLENSLEDNFFFQEIPLVQKFIKRGNDLVALNTKVDEISVTNEKGFSFPLWSELDKNSVYRSVLYFSKSLDPSVPAIGDISKEEVVIKVVETRHWTNTKGTYPLEEKSIAIATEISDSEHNISVGHNGYIMQTEALLNARYNPTTYDTTTMQGEIFAVNQEAQSIESATDGENDLVVAWYQYFADGKLAWANKAVRYAPQWVTGKDRIVIASRMGTDGLDDNETNRARQFMFDASLYENVDIYAQNDLNQAGYNPNEEHALIAPSFFYSDVVPKPNTGYALRHDLNQADNTRSDYTSMPYVLMQYQNRITGKYGMKLYTIQSEDNKTIDEHKSYLMDTNADGVVDARDGNGSFNYSFSYPIYAGDKVVAPYPLNIVIGANSIKENYGDNAYGINGYWEDKDTNSWAIAGGTKFDSYFWYPMLDGFWHPDKTMATGHILPFTHNSYDIDNKSHSRNSSAYFVSKGDEYQHFAKEFKVTYNAYWKPNLAQIRLGETLTFAGGEEKKDTPSATGLPSAVAWASAEIVYDEMNKASNVNTWLGAEEYSVRIQPAVRELKTDMSSIDFPENLAPASKLTVNKGGKWFFEELHAGLKQRVYFDQVSNKMVLRGLLNDKFAGDTELTKSPGGYNYILQPNILTIDDINTLLALTNVNNAIKTSFVQLYALSLNPNLSDEDLVNIDFSTSLESLLANYTVGMVRFLRDNSNRLLVVSSLGSSNLSQEMQDKLPNATLPTGLALADVEMVTEDKLPKGIQVEDVDTILALQQGGKLVRIKEGKGYVPASQLGTGLALFTNPNLAEPSADFNGSHIVIAENNDPAIKGSPVLLHILKVNNRPYRGQIKTVLSDNVFDEKITLRHTGDFGANIKDLVFEWVYRETDGFEIPPYLYADPSCPNEVIPTGSNGKGWMPFVDDRTLPDGYVLGQGRYELVFGKSTGKDVLVDNSFYVRYRHKDSSIWSGWAGSGGNNPCNTPQPVYKSQLVKGWVKRVTDNVNVFDARIKDFSSDGAPATYVSMIEQIGFAYVGDVALNNDKDVIENVGLSELYQTVLNRAKNLSIDAAQPASSDGVVQALQNAASRISQFYMLLGNEAYSDALDPTIGFRSSDGTYGNLAPTIFTFQNQVASLAQEELVLLRGREGTQEGDTGAAPVHNRFLWNFTNNDGEAAYALSYNIKDKNDDGFIDYQDAKSMYPQGHGDAWGHYLTGLQTYYKLLGHSEFNWVSRAEKYEIDGITLDVDYLDERRFAEAAAAKAKVGSEIVALTYRQRYEEDPEGQWQGYKDTQAYRAWGIEGWVKRSHIGAYFDWITANAILPAEDSSNTGIQKIDRTTVAELQEIAINGNDILTQLSQINAGQNPLGLLPDVVPFDIDPTSGDSQFEQVYARAEEALKNAKNVFDYANELEHRIREVADTQEEFSEQVYDQDMEYKNRLIEIFGTPYEGIIGAGKAYPEGYSGADINFYQYVDVAEVSEETLPSQTEANAYVVSHTQSIGYSESKFDPKTQTSKHYFAKYYASDMPFGYNSSMTTEPEVLTLNYPLNQSRYMFNAPDFWGQRKTSGSIQIALTQILKADVDMRLAEKAYRGITGDLGRIEAQIRAREALKGAEVNVIDGTIKDTRKFSAIIGSLETASTALGITGETLDDVEEVIVEAIPKVVGLSIDATAPIRGAVKGGMSAAKLGISLTKVGLDVGIRVAETEEEISNLVGDRKIVNAEADFEIKEMLLEIDLLLDSEPELRMALFRAKEVVRQATQKYTRLLGQGLRLLDEREAFNKRVAAKTHGKRYQDMAFRLNRTEASQKYRAAFDLAAKYAYLAAKAYDYETNLSPKHIASAQHILKSIIQARTIGEVQVDINGVEPVVGQGGLADVMARLKANFKVLKTQMGMNNPQLAQEPFSLRSELFRISADNNISWEKTLAKHYTQDIWNLPEFRTHMRPFASEEEGEQAGIVIPFSTNIISGLNFFGFPLSANDHAYDASQYSTKIRSVGISFEGYKDLGLASTARAYLVPVGQDVMLVPDSNELDTREWNIKDQKIPVPLPFGKSDMERSSWMPLQSLDGAEGQIRRHSRIRVHHDSGTVDANNMQTDSRLYGRSVWNTRWLLVIPGESLLNPAQTGIETLIHGKIIPGSIERDGKGISDIKLTFETYSYSGN